MSARCVGEPRGKMLVAVVNQLDLGVDLGIGEEGAGSTVRFRLYVKPKHPSCCPNRPCQHKGVVAIPDGGVHRYVPTRQRGRRVPMGSVKYGRKRHRVNGSGCAGRGRA